MALRPLYINLGYIKDYSPLCGIYRANLFTGFRFWISETPGTFNFQDNGIPKNLSATGMPQSLAGGQVLATLGFVDLGTKGVDFGQQLEPYTTGNYIVDWTGPTMTVSVGGNATALTVLSPNRVRFTVPTATNAGIQFRITAMSGAIDNLRMFRESEESAIASDPWSPWIVADMAIMAGVRWMESLDTNQDSSTTLLPDNYLFWTVKGPPIEKMADFSNRYSVDAWWCCPTKLSTATMDSALNRWKTALSIQRHLYLEYANELWNFFPYQDPPGAWNLQPFVPATHIFTLANDLQPHPTLPGKWEIGPGAIDPDPYIAAFKQCGLSSQIFLARVAAIFSGADANRVTRVLGTQYVSIGGGGFDGQVQTAIDNCAGCQAVAGAPYIPTVATDPAFSVDSNTVQQILAAYQAQHTTVEFNIKAFAQVVVGKGKQVLWYEASASQMKGSQVTQDHSKLLQVQQHPDMYDHTKFVLDKCEKYAPGSPIYVYSGYSYGGPEGQLGHKRYPGEPEQFEPKWLALEAFHFADNRDPGGPQVNWPPYAAGGGHILHQELPGGGGPGDPEYALAKKLEAYAYRDAGDPTKWVLAASIKRASWAPSVIDFDAADVQHATLADGQTYTLSVANAQPGARKVLELSGNANLIYPAGFRVSGKFDGSNKKQNRVSIRCVASNLYDVMIETLPAGLAALLFRQSLLLNNTATLFDSHTDVLDTPNGTPATANVYSILKNVEQYRKQDGFFEFRIKWPNLTGNDAQPKYAKWRQRSNPIDETSYETVEGFQLLAQNMGLNPGVIGGLCRTSSFNGIFSITPNFAGNTAPFIGLMKAAGHNLITASKDLIVAPHDQAPNFQLTDTVEVYAD